MAELTNVLEAHEHSLQTDFGAAEALILDAAPLMTAEPGAPALEPMRATLAAGQGPLHSALMAALGIHLLHLEHGEAALDLLHKSLALAEDEGNDKLIANTHLSLGQWHRWTCQADAAAKHLDRGMVAAKRTGEPGPVILGHLNRGALFLRMGEVRQAKLAFEDALTLSRRLGLVAMEGMSRNARGKVLMREGRLYEAYADLSAALAVADGHVTGMAQCHREHAEYFLHVPDHDQARTYASAAVRYFVEAEQQRSAAECKLIIAICDIEYGNLTSGAEIAHSVLHTLSPGWSRGDLQFRSSQAFADMLLGNVEHLQGNLAAACRCYGNALDKATQLLGPRRESLIRFFLSLARFQSKKGDASGILAAARPVFACERRAGERLARWFDGEPWQPLAAQGPYALRLLNRMVASV